MKGGRRMATNYQPYRDVQIQNGEEYQDFVVDCCWDLLGLAVVQYASALYQKTVGESRTGVEIKHDMKFGVTGNLWIELAEKAVPRPGPYAKSGIQRHDNSWLFIIGDYDTVFVFPITLLRLLASSGRYRHIENGSKTSVGFLLPVNDALKYASAVLHPNASEKIGKRLKDLHALSKELYDGLVGDGSTLQLPLGDS